MRISLFAKLCLVWSSGALGCAANPTPVDTLHQAVVTAYAQSRTATASVPLQRIDSAAISAHGITDIGDALRRLAGVNLRDYGGAGGVKTISVRGMGATHTIVTYDGLAVSDAQQGSIDLGRFSIDALSSMELHTLDNASLLCPVRNLGAATLSLFTAMPQPGEKSRWKGTLSLRQTSWNGYNPNLSLAKNVGERTALNVSADYFFGLNNYPFHVSNGAASETQRRTNSRMQKYSFELNLSQTTRKGGIIRAKAYYANNHRRLPGQVILYVNGNNERQTDENAFAQLHWQQSAGRWTMMSAARFNFQELRYTDIDGKYPGGELHQNYWQRELYTTFAASYSITEHWSAAYATDYALASLTSNLATDNSVVRHTWLQALSLQYASGRWNVTARCLSNMSWDKLRHTANAENTAATGQQTARNVSKVSPSLTASFTILHNPVLLRLRAGMKESFRQPTFTESYYYHLGSSTLLPEKVRQLNVGLTLQAAPSAHLPLIILTADAYCNRVSNRIVSVPYTLQVWRTVNLGRVNGKGLDCTLESHFSLTAKHALILSTNYSFQSITNGAEQGNFKEGVQLAYTPLHSGAASLAWENPWINAVAHTTFSSERWSTLEHMPTTCMPAYAECGFAFYRSFIRGKWKVDLRADLVNAFNKHYEVIRRYPMPGRNYKLSCIFHF